MEGDEEDVAFEAEIEGPIPFQQHLLLLLARLDHHPVPVDPIHGGVAVGDGGVEHVGRFRHVLGRDT